MVTEDFKELVEKIKSKGIMISRIPEKAKEQFVKLAEEEFCDDYGMLLKWLLEQTIEYQEIKLMLFANFASFSTALELLNNKVEQIEKSMNRQPERVIKTVSGEEIKIKKKEEKNGRE